MSMPGFVFYFRCDPCDANSDSYPIFPFSSTVDSDILLPAWSRTYRCWSSIRLSLSREQRNELESNREGLLEFAKTLSTEALTVGVRLLGAENQNSEAIVRPDPICPYCGFSCRIIDGYPPRERGALKHEIPSEVLDVTPIYQIELSVRTKNICSLLGIETLGQLRERREEFVGDRRVSEASIAEIDEWLKAYPENG